MTEAEKLDAGLEYDFWDPEVDGRKTNAVIGCQKLESISILDTKERTAAICELFGSAGENVSVLPGFIVS